MLALLAQRRWSVPMLGTALGTVAVARRLDESDRPLRSTLVAGMLEGVLDWRRVRPELDLPRYVLAAPRTHVTGITPVLS